MQRFSLATAISMLAAPALAQSLAMVLHWRLRWVFKSRHPEEWAALQREGRLHARKLQRYLRRDRVAINDPTLERALFYQRGGDLLFLVVFTLCVGYVVVLVVANHWK